MNDCEHRNTAVTNCVASSLGSETSHSFTDRVYFEGQSMVGVNSVKHCVSEVAGSIAQTWAGGGSSCREQELNLTHTGHSAEITG